jgi:uncharacterized protein
MPPRTTTTLLGLLLTLGLASLPFDHWDNEFASVSHLILNEIIWWLLIAATLAFVTTIERRLLTSIGFRALTHWDILLAPAAAVVILAGLFIIANILLPAFGLHLSPALNNLRATPLWWQIISVLRAGFAEEILFRGYPIERLHSLTGSKAIAAILPLIIFTLAHVPDWGWPHLAIAGFGGAALTVLYLWRRNLWLNIATHCLIDAVAVFVQ